MTVYVAWYDDPRQSRTVSSVEELAGILAEAQQRSITEGRGIIALHLMSESPKKTDAQMQIGINGDRGFVMYGSPVPVDGGDRESWITVNTETDEPKGVVWYWHSTYHNPVWSKHEVSYQQVLEAANEFYRSKRLARDLTWEPFTLDDYIELGQLV